MRKLLMLVVLLLVAVTPALAQEELPDFIQHSECEVDLTGQTVTIYHFGDISGSFAFITQPLLAGLSDAIAYYNERGGICGATITTDNRDTGGDLAQTQAHYDYYSTLDPKPASVLLYASADAELLREQLAEDEILALISAGSVPGLYGEDGASPGWIYATNPLYADQIGSFCRYVGANPAEFPENPTIGYISWPGAFGEAAYTPETVGYCAEQGVTILEAPEYFPPTATDISGNVLNLVDAGANILYTNSLASGPFLVAKTVVDLGLEEDVVLAGVNWALDSTVGLLSRTAIGSDGLPASNGMYGSLPFLWWTERAEPGIALINEVAAANQRTLPTQNIAYILAWGALDTYVELYIQTVNRVGSLEAATGAELKTTLESMVYSPLGLYNSDYRGGEIRALPGNRIARMFFLNATGDGPATSGDDAMKVDFPDGTVAFIPILAPVTPFEDAPDLRPGGADAP